MNARKESGWWWVPSLYFAEGLPYVVVMTLAGIMYTKMGVSNTEMAFYTSWLMLPWLVKPLWSPIVDILSTKRRWVIAMQWLLALSLGCVAFALPGELWFRFTMASFFAIAFLSATHDIAADGFYMLGLTEEKQSFFVGIRTTFYRAAMLFCQGPVVMAAGYMEESTGSITRAWAITFYGLSALFLCFALYNSICMPRVEHTRSKLQDLSAKRRIIAVLKEFMASFITFFRKPHIAAALAFMVLYKLPEAQIIKMINPFLLHPLTEGGLGLSTKEVGIVYGTVGVTGLLLGGIIGGIVVARGGLRRWVMPMAWSMSLTCLTFVYLSYASNHSLFTIGSCVFLEQFGYGFGGTAYILYLIRFSAGTFKTSHYAICTGFMTLGSMLPGMAAGWIEDQLGYGPFFLWTAACCAVTILASMAVRHHIPKG